MKINEGGSTSSNGGNNNVLAHKRDSWYDDSVFRAKPSILVENSKAPAGDQ